MGKANMDGSAASTIHGSLEIRQLRFVLFPTPNRGGVDRLSDLDTTCRPHGSITTVKFQTVVVPLHVAEVYQFTANRCGFANQLLVGNVVHW